MRTGLKHRGWEMTHYPGVRGLTLWKQANSPFSKVYLEVVPATGQFDKIGDMPGGAPHWSGKWRAHSHGRHFTL